jgi:cell division protein FtsQ
MPASVRRFARRARQRRLRTALPWLVCLAVLMLVGSFAGIVYGTSAFGVSSVDVAPQAAVDGPRAPGVSAEEVRLAAAVPPGTPLARLDLDAVRKRVAAYPPVARAEVSRSWPRTLVVRVWPRIPVAVVPLVGSYGLLDAAGVVFHQVADRGAPVAAGLPLLRVADPRPDDETTRSALTVLAALTPPLRDPLVALIADAPARIRLELSGGRVILWGDATENAKKARVAANVLAAPGDNHVKTLDVSAPSVVTVR